MSKLNVVDLISIQECLEGYRIMLDMIVPEDTVELDLWENKLQLTKYLVDKIDIILKEIWNVED